MSRIGRQPIPVPAGVEVSVSGRHVTVKGKLGELEHTVPDELEVSYDAEGRSITVSRCSEARRARELHGLTRTLIANKVHGVSEGFAKSLEIYGTGYSAEVRGKALVLTVGFSHEVTFELVEGISAEVTQKSAQLDNPARFTVKGIDKELVGQFAARVRDARPPEPYKGKGIRYQGEYVRRKEVKALGGL